MTYTYIKFESQTQGEKAKALLLKNGIKSHLRRNPNPDRKQGCNFALFVEGNIWKAYELITTGDIKSSGVENYRERI